MNKVFDGVFGTADHDPKVQWSGHVCHQSGNPRDEGRCACGKALSEPPEASESVRDVAYEETYLNEVASQAAKRFGIGSEGFAIAVQRRLEMGQKRYGNQFMELDLGREGSEEGLDGGAYAVLDTQKQMAIGTEDTDERAFHMFEAAVHSAAATWHFQQARTV